MFTPTTNLRLLSVPLESDYSNTLWFPNVEAQTTYFTGKIIKTFDDFNYIKKDNTIVVAEEIDKLYNCNYIMYKNTNFSTRWFYAFINRMEWASNGSTRLYVSTDVIQTWFFDITYYQSYVDRCHSDTDVAGDNIVPEDFTTGDAGGYQIAGSLDLSPNEIVLFATANSNGSVTTAGGAVNGIYSGAVPVLDGVSLSSPSVLQTTLNDYVNNGTANAIAKIQQYPSSIAISGGKLLSFNKTPTNINGYKPTNNKMLSAAFISCFISMYGQECSFSPAFISQSIVALKVVCDKTSGMITTFVTDYSDEKISNFSISASIPESSWSYNQYKNDYNLHSDSNGRMTARMRRDRTSNIVNSALGLVDSALSGVGAITQAGFDYGQSGLTPYSNRPSGYTTVDSNRLVSSVRRGYNSANELINSIAGIDSISQELAYIKESYNAPAVGSTAASNTYITGGQVFLTYGYKVPPLDLVKRCDKFLSVYGYKQSEYRTINLHARSNWTYIRTLGLNASGNFPDDDMKVIKQVFDKGVFFWSYTAQFGNFDQVNPIV